MSRISQEAYNYIGMLLPGGKGTVVKSPKSFATIAPGDLYIFTYSFPSFDTKIFLSVATKKGKGIYYNTNTKNILLTGFKLNNASPEVSAIILSYLYKNRALSEYSNVKKGLSRVLGSESFRTYKLKQVSNFHNIEFNKEDLINAS